MLLLEDHDVSDYQTLLDMDATDVSRLSESDRRCLNALGAYLVEAACYKRFSIWLLHKHFHPMPREVFVEWVLSDERARLTGPGQGRTSHQTSSRRRPCASAPPVTI